jgi:hypothetical protein
MAEDQIFNEETRAEMPVEVLPPDAPNPGFWRQYRFLIWVIAAAALICAGAWFFLSRQHHTDQPVSDNVVLLVKGPDHLTSGNEGEYTITYRNGENADLVGINLEMLYPSGFKFKSATPAAVSEDGTSFNLDDVKPGDTGSVVIRGTLSGGTGEDKEIRAQLHYRLSNFNSEFLAAESAHTVIQAPNLLLDIKGPVDVVNGQDTTYTLSITNVSAQTVDNMAVELTYPAGFSYTSSTLPPSKDNNYWTLNSMASGAAQSIEITGSFTGSDNEEKLIRADLGQIINNNFAPQIASTATFRVIPSSLSLAISAQPDSYVKLGDTITYKLSYMNRGSIGLKNLVITANLDSPVLDLSRISASDGIITGSTVTWKSATSDNLELLAPNQKGELTFSVPVRSSLTTNLKNQTVRLSAGISSDEISNPTRAGDSVLNLLSGLDLDVSAGAVSGAVPMQVGQTTVIAVTMILSNLSNDLSGTQVTASLPLPSSSWNGVIIPDSEKSRLTFDPNSGKITWKIGDMAAFAGKFTPALQATFQLAVTPTQNDSGKNMDLLRDITASATDTFVNLLIASDNIKTISTSDVDGLSGGTVQ